MTDHRREGRSEGAPVQASYVLCMLLAVPAAFLFVAMAGPLGVFFGSFAAVVGWMVYMSARSSQTDRASENRRR